jgi:hypothetical protein
MDLPSGDVVSAGDLLMPHRLRRLLLYVCLLLALAGCAIGTSSGVTALPCAAQTAAAATAGATATSTPGAGTRTNSPLVITTDRTVYAPLDGIHVTITNHLQTNPATQVYVILTPPGPRCPGAQAERLQRSVWQEVPVCLPGGGGEIDRGTGEITVYPGETYDLILTALTNRLHNAGQDPFPTGVYRVAVHYYILAPQLVIIRYGMGGGFIAYSQPIRVCTCGVCA